jgi:hypothetical protein
VVSFDGLDRFTPRDNLDWFDVLVEEGRIGRVSCSGMRCVMPGLSGVDWRVRMVRLSGHPPCRCPGFCDRLSRHYRRLDGLKRTAAAVVTLSCSWFGFQQHTQARHRFGVGLFSPVRRAHEIKD